MKGVILAGGLGSRLMPLTKVTNKHLLPIFQKPMIHYPLECLVKGGVKDVLIVTGGDSAGHFLRLLGSGSDFGARIYYAYQQGEGGIADALRLAEAFIAGDRVAVVLGDNILQRSIKPSVDRFLAQSSGARILLKEVPDPQRFGVAEVKGDEVVGIVEKPKQPKSNLAVTGIYFYDAQVFDIIRTLQPSGRGELEITDVNNAYLAKRQLQWDRVEGWWSDAGTFESLYKASTLVRDGGANLD
ncbi:MAG: spore coat protein [Planctomycetes bacterium]|nr:spore coat protein [Planctomycetota bacterium]